MATISETTQSQTFPCGAHAHYGNTEHIEKCKACKVVLGMSKQHKGFTQKEVAQIFQQLDRYEAESGTGNFYTYGNGVLMHYRTIEAIKTHKGKIISNLDCYGGGFAYCTTPTKTDAHINLTLMLNAVLRKELLDIEILDIDKDAILFKIGSRHFLNASDSQRFVVELAKPCESIKEAYTSMKPTLAKDATQRGLNVKRQGDLFFIPTTLSDKDVSDIEKTKYEQHTLEFPEIQFSINEPTNHHATRTAKYRQHVLVKGTVRHRQHRLLKLGNAWHIVVRNNVKNAWSNIGRD